MTTNLIEIEGQDNRYVAIIPSDNLGYGVYPSRDLDKHYLYYDMGFPYGERIINVDNKFKIVGNYTYEKHTHIIIEKIIGITMDNINISDEKFQRLAEQYKQKAIIETHQYRKVENKIKLLVEGDIDDFDDAMRDFIKWEEEQEDLILKRHTSFSVSNLFSNIFQVWENLGRDVTIEESFNGDKPFLGHAYLYNGYLMEVHCGQGCYYRIYKNDECLFQSY
jgi:hypothetical protein